MKGLDLTDNQKAALLAIHAEGGKYTYAQAVIAGQARMLGCWSLVRSKGLAVYAVYAQQFELTDKGTLIARMLLK